MALTCVGLSHLTAPAEVRERHAFPRERIGEALVALRDYPMVREAAILSTCNRLEIYAELDDHELGLGQLREFLVNFRHGSITYDIEPYLYELNGSAAIAHLLRVATGLDSLLLGDAQVLGQVKDAYATARKAGSVGKTLHRAFREALNAGKAARTRTPISNESVSIATAAIEIARKYIGSPAGKRVLLIGAGKMGQTAAKRLKLEGAAEIAVANRTHQRAKELVEKLGVGYAVEFPSLREAISSADVVITSTGATHFILNVANVAEAMLERADRQLLIIDIAVPRDVDPDVARLPNVSVVDIDRMTESVDATLEHRRAAIPMVEDIVAAHVTAFQDWSRESTGEVASSIASMSRHAEAVRRSEFERLLSRCPGLDEREKQLIAGLSLRIVSKLLHPAIMRLRDACAAEPVDATLPAQTDGGQDLVGLERRVADT